MIVLHTTRPVVETARQVRIDDAAIAAWAREVDADALRPSGHALLSELPGNREQKANLVLLIDGLNFCFWGAPPPRVEWRGTTYHGFNAMLAAILQAVQREPAWFDPRFWLRVSSADFRATVSPDGGLAMLDERERILRETADTLLKRFDGQFVTAVESVNEHAWDLAALLLASFDSFRDVAEYDHRPVFFAKRAQICALDLSVAWERGGFEPLCEMEQLTAFADYRLPQALRHLGILRLTEELATRIDAHAELAAGSSEEIELRAASIWAVERMRDALAARGIRAAAWEIDWYLWDRAHAADVTAAHHRTRTTFY